MKEKIEAALASKNVQEARNLLKQWIASTVQQFGFGIPEGIQAAQRASATLIEQEALKQRSAAALAERRAGWMSPEAMWDDQPGSRMRQARLLVRSPQGRLEWFLGKPLQGITVIGSERVRQGKWSHTKHRLGIQAGFAAIPTTDGFNSGTVLAGLGQAVGLTEMATAQEIAEVLQVAPEEVERVIGSPRS